MTSSLPRDPYTIDNGHGEQLTFTGVVQAEDGLRALAEGVAQPGAGAPMHVHFLQTEAVQVVSGRLGHQSPDGEPQFAGPGECVVWPPGTPHKWWNAGDGELRTTGWCSPPDSVEFYLSALFESAKRNGGRPGLFDAAFLLTRYRSEFAMIEMPAIARRVGVPVLYALGRMLGRHRKYAGAPPPVRR